MTDHPLQEAAPLDSTPAGATSELPEQGPAPAEAEAAQPPYDPTQDPEYRYLNRELSWLSFNGRVLQEAMDPRLPVFDRLTFLAIFYSNLDEFFRVRVASLRSLLRLKKKKLKKLEFRPGRLLRDIHFTATTQQETLSRVFRGEILPALEANGIFLLDQRSVSLDQVEFLRRHFTERLRPHLHPQLLSDTTEAPFLEAGTIYLVAELWPGREMTLASERPSYGLLGIPGHLPRFVVIPGEGQNVIFLDDVVRLFLGDLFPGWDAGSAYAVKLSRDAELYLEEEFEGDLVEKIRKSLTKRETGLPARFLYDFQAPYALVAFMKELLALADEDLVPGGRYHNLQDLACFPRPRRMEGLVREPLPPLPHPGLEGAPSVLEAVARRDHILHLPYQSFHYVTRFLEEAADDPGVESISITLYRVAEESAVVKALMRAARRGARVTAFVEVQARFDEARNLRWAEEMAEAGVRTIYSMPGMKVHAKLALVSRREGEGTRLYAYLSTGNFNENTARVYADHGLFTADPRLTQDALEVFRFLCQGVAEPSCQHLLVAPFTLRPRLVEILQGEGSRAGEGTIAGAVLKLNSLEDTEIIDLLYGLGQAGLRLNLIVRAICRLRPGLPGVGEGIRGRSIVDRFLEHARIYRFVNGGSPLLYLSSADLMKRNLDRRVEVAFPVFDPLAREELEQLLHLQLSDNTKARLLDADQENHYVGRRAGEPRVEAQEGFYRWLEARLAKSP